MVKRQRQNGNGMVETRRQPLEPGDQPLNSKAGGLLAKLACAPDSAESFAE